MASAPVPTIPDPLEGPRSPVPPGELDPDARIQGAYPDVPPGVLEEAPQVFFGPGRMVLGGVEQEEGEEVEGPEVQPGEELYSETGIHYRPVVAAIARAALEKCMSGSSRDEVDLQEHGPQKKATT